MIYKKLFFFILLIMTGHILACEIHLPEQILTLGDHVDLSKVMMSSQCSQETLSEVNQTLKNSNGKIGNFQLSEILKFKNHNVSFKPNLVHIQHLKNLVHEQIPMPTGVQMRSSEAINANNFMALNLGDRIEVSCIGCLFGSNQTLNVIVHGMNGSKTSLTVKADFKKMVKAYRVTSFQPAFSEISLSSLTEDFTETIPHTELFSELENLKFYKLNKPLRLGDLLRKSDLNRVNLVRAGSRTEVIIENELIKLKTHGISRNNGGIGEMVEVFHTQKNKKYLGKIIEHNKVLVEL